MNKAVAIIQEARTAHVQWMEALEKDPTGGETCEPVVTAGDIAHHRRWVDNYDIVLEALET